MPLKIKLKDKAGKTKEMKEVYVDKIGKNEVWIKRYTRSAYWGGRAFGGSKSIDLNNIVEVEVEGNRGW